MKQVLKLRECEGGRWKEEGGFEAVRDWPDVDFEEEACGERRAHWSNSSQEEGAVYV